MSWAIDGEARFVSPPHGEATSWVWPLISDDDRSCRVLVAICESAMDKDRGALSDRIDLARRTSGRSEVERVLGWAEPPAEIKVDPESVQHFGSDAGPQLAH
jgi:hypothetical protein